MLKLPVPELPCRKGSMLEQFEEMQPVGRGLQKFMKNCLPFKGLCVGIEKVCEESSL